MSAVPNSDCLRTSPVQRSSHAWTRLARSESQSPRLVEVGGDQLSAVDLSERAPRSSRLPRFVGSSVDADHVLGGLEIAVIGVGSVGATAALSLSRMQPAAIWIVDPGRFKPESVLTQPILPADVGGPKASTIGKTCKLISPLTRVFVFDGPVETLDSTAFSDADVVLLATDRLAPEVEIGQRCLHLGRRLIQASVHPASLTGQLRIFANRDSQGACPACAYGAQEWQRLSDETRYSCEDGVVPSCAEPITGMVGEPTRSLAALCQTVGNQAVLEIARHELRLGSAVQDRVIEYCAYTHQTRIAQLRRNPNCPCLHTAWVPFEVRRTLGDYSLRSLAVVAGAVTKAAIELTTFQVEDLVFVESATCSCGRTEAMSRFVTPGESLGDCRHCGGQLTGSAFTSHRPVAGTVLGAVLDRRLSELTDRLPDWTVVSHEERATWFRTRSNPDLRAPDQRNEQ